MKNVLTLALIFLVFSCNKKDVKWGGKVIKCDVSQMGGTFKPHGISYTGAFKKTYNASGLPQSLVAVIYGNFASVDSLLYEFSYLTGKVHVKAKKRNFRLGVTYADPLILDPDFPPSAYEFDATFDAKGNALTIGASAFVYTDGRLTSHNGYAIVYDDKGNITRANGGGGSVAYQYDYTKTAKGGQFYPPSGYQTGEMYNLGEIMGWIPVQPKNLRTRHIIDWGGYIAGELPFTNHKLNSEGQLISYSSNDELASNTWNCKPITVK